MTTGRSSRKATTPKASLGAQAASVDAKGEFGHEVLKGVVSPSLGSALTQPTYQVHALPRSRPRPSPWTRRCKGKPRPGRAHSLACPRRQSGPRRRPTTRTPGQLRRPVLPVPVAGASPCRRWRRHKVVAHWGRRPPRSAPRWRRSTRKRHWPPGAGLAAQPARPTCP